MLAKFTQTIVKCRPISQTGAEQILLDLQALKNCLMHLVLAPGDPAPIPTSCVQDLLILTLLLTSRLCSYSRYVTRNVQNIDTLLKILMSPEDPPDDFVKHYLLLIPCQSFSDFQKVLDLKVGAASTDLTARRADPPPYPQGVRRAEQNQLLDIFLARTSTASGLSDSSFLTTLDMDPASKSLTSPSASGLASPTTAGSNLGLFGFGGASSITMLQSGGGSRDGSRVGTPILGGRDGGGKEERAFARLGARLGTRFFGGASSHS